MVDYDGLGAALCLGALARVVDDEGVEMRHGAEYGFWKTGRAKGERLAGEPLKIAVLAEMDNGVGREDMAKPQIHGEVVVRRDKIGRVVGGLGIDVVAAGRLYAHDKVAVKAHGKAEDAAVAHGVVLWRAPSGLDVLLHLLWQRGQEGLVCGELESGGGIGCAPLPSGVCRAGAQVADEVGAVPWGFRDLVALAFQRLHGGDHALGRVETDAVAKAPVAVGVVRHDEGHPAARRGQVAQPCPVRGQRRGEVGAVRGGLEGRCHGVGGRVAGRFALEAHGPCQDAPVELRQGHVHGDVARGEARRRGAPLVGLAGAKHQLEDRGVEGFEGAGVGVGDGGVG